MNSFDQQLDRLLKSARRAPVAPEPRLTFAGELNVLAQWRKARAAGDVFNWLPLLRRAVAVACVVAMAVAVGSVTLKPAPAQNDELSSLNEVVNAAAAWL
ncbi:MAG TPA: hypothetical protein VK530_18355 [Candidatus Acidoferrum sp.]|nr:hypothetical protein [Candidatus Acidoferrum sp.]